MPGGACGFRNILSKNVVSYLGFLIDLSSGDHVCSIFDKRSVSVFRFVNFPDLSWNISTTLANITCISQPIRLGRDLHSFEDFFPDIPCLKIDFPMKDFLQEKKAYKIKFMDRYSELASKFNRSPSFLVCDCVAMTQIYHTMAQLHHTIFQFIT